MLTLLRGINMKQENFSALAVTRAVRDNLISRLEHNEDFRVWRGLEFVLATEARRAMAQNKVEDQSITNSAKPEPMPNADSKPNETGAATPKGGARTFDLQQGW